MYTGGFNITNVSIWVPETLKRRRKGLVKS
jgi:hypothetical protein